MSPCAAPRRANSASPSRYPQPLCVATLALWVRSYWKDDHLGQLRFRLLAASKALVHRHGLFSGQGQLAFCDGTDIDLAPASATPQDTQPQGVTHYGWFSGDRYDFAGWYAERDADFLFGFGSNQIGRGPGQ